jgi:hypothetical protein
MGTFTAICCCCTCCCTTTGCTTGCITATPGFITTMPAGCITIPPACFRGLHPEHENAVWTIIKMNRITRSAHEAPNSVTNFPWIILQSETPSYKLGEMPCKKEEIVTSGVGLGGHCNLRSSKHNGLKNYQ